MATNEALMFSQKFNMYISHTQILRKGDLPQYNDYFSFVIHWNLFHKLNNFTLIKSALDLSNKWEKNRFRLMNMKNFTCLIYSAFGQRLLDRSDRRQKWSREVDVLKSGGWSPPDVNWTFVSERGEMLRYSALRRLRFFWGEDFRSLFHGETPFDWPGDIDQLRVRHFCSWFENASLKVTSVLCCEILCNYFPDIIEQVVGI